MQLLKSTVFTNKNLFTKIKTNYNKFDKFDKNLQKNNKRIFNLFIFNILSFIVLLYSYTKAKSYKHFSMFELYCLCFSFIVTISHLIILKKLNKTSNSLKKYMLYNETLTLYQENLHNFKHDYSNTLQCIGGYIHSGNMTGLKEYYLELLDDCQRINSLTAVSPNLINNPGIYNIIATKYIKAEELNVKMSVNVFMDLDKIDKDVYSITRILGILLDNAIEACCECAEKNINICFSHNKKKDMYSILIENTFNKDNLNIDKIYEKGFSTKINNSGLGLFSVNKILNKSKNLSLHTTTTDNIFSQELEIWN